MSHTYTHVDADLAPTGPTPASKVHKLSLKEAHDQGYLDGRLFYHDGALWRSLSRAKRAAYDRGNVSGRKSPIRC